MATNFETKFTITRSV